MEEKNGPTVTVWSCTETRNWHPSPTGWTDRHIRTCTVSLEVSMADVAAGKVPVLSLAGDRLTVTLPKGLGGGRVSADIDPNADTEVWIVDRVRTGRVATSVYIGVSPPEYQEVEPTSVDLGGATLYAAYLSATSCKDCGEVQVCGKNAQC